MATGHSGFDQRLLEAARRCDGRTLEGLVKEGKANLNAADKTGCTAVHLCCKAADLASLALLLKHGARTDLFDNKGMAPIHHAAIKDYIETMEVLVSSGASVNIQNEISKETPLHIAATNRTTRSIKFLLFCGADARKKDKFGKVADLGLSKEKLDKYSDVSTAFNEGHIEVFGKIIDTFERATFKSAGVTISNTSTKSKQFTFFCRKIKVDHVTLSVSENEGISTYLKECNRELISDVYEYLVNQAIDEVWVSVPVFTQATDFDTVYFLDNTGNKFKCTGVEKIDQVVYYTACIVFKAFEDTINSFAVVMETKSDIYVFDGKAQTCSSSVESGFEIHLPENCLPRNTKVVLKVIPTVHYQQVLNTDLMKSTSHFCEIIINQNTRKALSISLPVPKGHGELTEQDADTRMAVFHSLDASEPQPDWKEIESSWKPGSENITVTDKSIKKGTCIVAVIPKKRGNGIFNKIKQFIKWLYDTATRRKEQVCFFAMTKQSSKDRFRLLVVLCDKKALNENVKYWESDKYIGEKSQYTQSYLASSRAKFVAQLNSTKEEIFLTYHRQSPSYEDFIVTGKERDFIKVLIYKEETESNVGEDGRKLKSLTQINVELKGNEQEREQSAHNLQFTEYPDDRFLSWLAHEIGHEWMMIGICLGFNLSFLERIERDNTPTRANLTMLYAWRTEQSKAEDLGLKVLLHSLASARRNDLVTKINEEVQALLTTKPDGRVSRWIQKLLNRDKEPLKEAGGLDEIDGPSGKQLTECGEPHGENLCINCLTEPDLEASPMSEKFLAHLATMMGSNIQLLLQLGLFRSDIDEIRHSISNPTYVMFKCLLLAKRRYKDQADFFQEMMEGLKIQQNIQIIRKVQEMSRNWFKTNKSPMDNQMRKLEQIIKIY